MRLADFILANIEPILAEWEVFARGIWPGAAAIDPATLRDHAEAMLRSTVPDMQSDQTGAQQSDKARGKGDDSSHSAGVDRASVAHGSGRHESRFDLAAVIAEYRALRASVIRLWRESHPTPDRHDLADLSRFNESIDQSLTTAVLSFTDLVERERQAAIDLQSRRAGELRELNDALLVSAVRQQELTEKSEALSVRLQAAIKGNEYFIAVLSHELRTPLTPVLLAASMLHRDQRLDLGTREIMQMIHHNVTLEARLIDDLLDMTRMERGKLELDRRLVDLREVMERAIEVCRADVESGGLTLEVDTGDKPLMVVADASRIQQVFSNLLRNAIKFTPAGGRIAIRSRCDEDSCGMEISDSGAGIDPEFLPRAFNAFEQGDKTHARKAGLGLGLAISKTVVELHGGVITAQSEGKGRGATFAVSLPIMIGDQPVREETDPAAPDGPRTVKPLRILLVEDHADTARIMRRLLTLDGHAVQWAGDVAAGLKLAAAHKFDLLLSDVGLPDGTGVDLMRTLRQRGSTLPGIVLSGYGQDEDVTRSREAGFAAHLVKPLSSQILRDAIVALTG